jgi:hypothetical protein
MYSENLDIGKYDMNIFIKHLICPKYYKGCLDNRNNIVNSHHLPQASITSLLNFSIGSE